MHYWVEYLIAWLTYISRPVMFAVENDKTKSKRLNKTIWMLFPNVTVTEKDICDDSRLMMAFKQDKLEGSVGKHLVYCDGYFNEKRETRNAIRANFLP